MSTVGDIMSTGLFSIEPTTTVAEAATVMGERRIGSALVMEDDMLLGIFTERDIVRALGEHFDAAGHPVSDWMTPNPVTVEASTPVEDALRMMLDRNFRHLPVAEGGRVSGIVSMRDLTAAGVAAPSEG
ncbi:MAG TPA: CBS domain-containing protein [Actinomycetota bacterium]|nr:CBS domain-containing protein [Actinomycetota bacterium]